MLQYIFSVLLIAAVWTTVVLLELPIWIAIVATVVIVAVLASFIIYKIVKAKKAARAIERALKAQADAQAASARPDLKAEVDAMQGEFLKAVAALKTSKLGGKGGTEALYALPWYMIIGPPGAGKSTALRNSGLRFPYLSKSGGGIQGIGGTRNCEWWMTNEAVMLDTAGRYTTEDADRDEWMAFLELLKKNRPKRPINGVVVALPVVELAEAHPDEILARAREIRARVDEVMSKLEMIVPVYVLFTKCDLLPGFLEIFSDLSGEELGQIWGFTVPVTGKEDPSTAFCQHFDALAKTIEHRALRRMSEERRAEARDKIFGFPQYFEPLRDKLAAFVGEVMAESIYTESPIFRGAYFTSGTQEGRPIDRIMNAVAEAFGVAPQIQLTEPQIAGKSYFLGELFRKVVFADKNVATRSAARLRRQALVGHAIAVGLVLLALGMAVLPVVSFRSNREFLTRVDEATGKVAEHALAETVDPIRVEQIDPLRTIERELAQHRADGPPLMMRMGMYQGDKVAADVRRLYFKTVREQLVQPLLALEVERLQRFVQKYAPVQDQAPQAEHDAFKARLEAYLLLTGPYAEGEPGLGDPQDAWLTEHLAQAWAVPLELSGDVATLDAMRQVAGTFVEILAADGALLFERDDKLVEGVRSILRRTNRTDALLAELLRDVEAHDLDLRTLTDSNVALKNDNRVVRGAYTRQAWENAVRDKLAQPLDQLIGDAWVLGRTVEEAQTSREDQVAQLESLYFENYIKEWKGFIGAIYVAPIDDYLDAQRVFEDLTHGATPPLKRLAQYVDYHTTLPAAPEPESEKDLAEEGLERGAEVLAKKGGKAGKAAGAAKKLLAKDDPARAGNPLLQTRSDIKAAFEGLARFGYVPQPPVAEGQPAPPPPAVPLDRYQEELARVRDAIRAKIDHDGPDEAKALANAVKSARTTVDSIINETDTQGWRSTFMKWLPPPFESVWRLVNESVTGVIAKNWCEDVYKPLQARVFSRRPFAKTGRDLSLDVFAEFFRPEEGAVWTYYGSALTGAIPRKHGTYGVAKSGAADRTQYNPALVGFLNRAHDLAAVLFPTGSDTMLVEIDVWIGDNDKAAETSLTIDGMKVSHRNGPGRWQRMRWPGEGDKRGGFIETKGRLVRGEVEREGNWGLFELLGVGTLKSGSADTDVFTVRWDLRDQEAGIVTIKFRPLEADSPFFGVREHGLEFMQIFKHPDLLSPPAQIILGSSTCGGI